ncbi:hypothetical protein I9W82_004700 [Candida metapsilosis]|uniref:Uncharacterized protein n=1 Tax=Candida metapsilosis TaxID=273372 RepID=A0A8H8D9F6_9ASCO|nr:hypothetical protein I9W82_004700 [Candida metapsilosis]
MMPEEKFDEQDKDLESQRTSKTDEKLSSNVSHLDSNIEKTTLEINHREAIEWQLSKFQWYWLFYMVSMLILSVPVTFFRSYFLGMKFPGKNYMMRSSLIGFHQYPINILHWRLKSNTSSAHSKFPVDRASKEYKVIIKHILRSPLLSFGYAAVIGSTMWLTFFCPMLTDAQTFSFILGLLSWPLIWIDRYVERKTQSLDSIESSNAAKSSVGCENGRSLEAGEQALEP